MNDIKKRMAWKCRRGMLELDSLLERFMAHRFEFLTDDEIVTFERLLKEPDPVLYSWFLGSETCDDQQFQKIIVKIVSPP